jgi:uncharacterized protein with HEPN domain
MSKREWRLFVEDILESIGLIQMYAENIKFTDFKKDRKTIDAIVRNFEIIGEASKYIPKEVKKKYKEIDWRGIVGLRNRIAHEYFDVSSRIIWQIVKDELPTLKEQMKQIKSMS